MLSLGILMLHFKRKLQGKVRIVSLLPVTPALAELPMFLEAALLLVRCDCFGWLLRMCTCAGDEAPSLRPCICQALKLHFG